MKKHQKGFAPIIILLIVLLLAGGIYVATKSGKIFVNTKPLTSSSPVSVSTNGLKTYVNEQYKFSFVYPDSYNQVQSVAVAEFREKEPSDGRIVFDDDQSPLSFPNQDITDWYVEFGDKTAGLPQDVTPSWNDAVKNDSSLRLVSLYNGTKIIVRTVNSNHKLYTTVLFPIQGKKILSLEVDPDTVGFDNEKQKVNLDLLVNQIISSIKFTN